MTDIQGTAAGAVDKFGTQIGEAVEKAGEFIDEKTGGKYSDQIQAGVGKVEDTLDGLDGQNDDIGADPQAQAPAEPSGEAPAEPQSESPAPDPTGQAEAPADPSQPSQPGTEPGYAPAEPETQPGYGTEPSTPEAGTTPQQ